MNKTARHIRGNILDISHQSGHGHIPTCFSIIEILLAVYGTIRHAPDNPDWDGRDIFVLSKGHASLGHYCVLAELGYFDIEGVRSFGNFGTRFGCHADRTRVPGVEVSTGSLGHGIGVGTGMALAQKIARTGRRVVILIGDGESNEGSVWEAIMIAVDQALDNLTIIYDDNKSQGRCLSIPNAAERFRAFGCHTVEVGGHDQDALQAALAKKSDKVTAIVAKTKKGYGCKTFVDNMYEWHRRSPDAETLKTLQEELHAWPV